MQDISYTISPTLKNEIEKIDRTRDKILTVLLSRSSEQLARWDANSQKTTFATRLTDHKLKTSDVQKIVNPFAKKTLDPETEGYFKAYQFIDREWFLNPEKITLSDIKKILKTLVYKKKVRDEDILSCLSFVQTTPEHPLIAAAIFFFLTYKIIGQSKDIKTSIILSNIFIYKGGYDMRGILSLEEFFVSDRDNFLRLLLSEDKNGLSDFLEYFVLALSIQAEKVYSKIISYKNEQINSSTMFKLTSRDLLIMNLFEKPGAKITNKIIQREFRISQITASRDLARLASLDLVVRRGKGRSIYYTKL